MGERAVERGYGWSCDLECAQGVDEEGLVIRAVTAGSDLTLLRAFLDELRVLQDRYFVRLDHCGCCEGLSVVSDTDPDHTLAVMVEFYSLR